MGGTRLLLVSAVLLLPVFSGCLDAAQEALGIDPDVEFEERVGFDDIELTYEVIPGDTGAYQFHVPPGIEALHLGAVEPEKKHGDGAHAQEPEAPAEEDASDARDSFGLFTVDGARIDPVREDDDGFSYRVSHPDAGAYVLMLYDELDDDVAIELEALSNEALAGAPFNAAILPLTAVTHRALLAEREAADAQEFSGTVEYPFPPYAFVFDYVGVGTEFDASVSSRVGVVYEESGPLPLGLGSAFGSPPPSSGCCYNIDDVQRENLEGNVYESQGSTDLVGKIYLMAGLFQPVTLPAMPVTVEAPDGNGGWEPSAGRSDLLDSKDGDAEVHEYTGDAKAGEGAYVFTVPDDAQALVLTASDDPDCDDDYGFGYCSSPETRVSLFDSSGARLGLFMLDESERLRLDDMAPGDYALYVHSGALPVKVGVVGQPPASARLHEQPLHVLATHAVTLTRTAPAVEAVAIDGIPLGAYLELKCPADKGLAFHAQLETAAGIALEANGTPYFIFPGESCFDQTRLGVAVPEAIVPGDATLTLDATGGVGQVVLKVVGLRSIGSGAHDERGGSGNRTGAPALPDLESLIG